MPKKFHNKKRIVGISPKLHFSKEDIKPLKDKYSINLADQEVINILEFHCTFIETEIEKIKSEATPTKKDEKQLLKEITEVSKEIHHHYSAIAKLTLDKLSPLVELLQGYGYDTVQAVEKSFHAIQKIATTELKSIAPETAATLPYPSARFSHSQYPKRFA